MNKTYCDWCGVEDVSEALNGNGYVVVRRVTIEGLGDEIELDLCDACRDRLDDAIEHKCKNVRKAVK